MKKPFIYLFLLFIPLISAGQIQLSARGGYIFFCFNNTNDGGPYSSHYSYPGNAYLFSVSARQKTLHVFNPGMELQYVNRSFGVQAGWGGHMSSTTVDFSFTTGNLVLQVQPLFIFGSKVKFFCYPGVYFGALLHSSVTGTTYSWSAGLDPSSKRDTLNGSARSYYPGLEFGLSPGIGFEFAVSNNLDIVFESTFTMNLTSMGKSWGAGDARQFNLNFEVGVGYTIGNGGEKGEGKQVNR